MTMFEIQTRVAPAGEEEPMSTHDRIAFAALTLMASSGEVNVSFAEVIKASHVSKATAYRIFQGGMPGVLQYLHARTVHDVISAIQARTRALPAEVTFEEAVASGVSGVLDGLRESPWPAQFLRTNRDLMTSYLLGREQGGICDVLSEYAARCAVNFGAMATDIEAAAAAFVWTLFSKLLSTFPAEGVRTPWPDLKDDATMQRYLEAPLAEFLERVELPRGTARPAMAAPIIRTPDSMGTGLAILTT